jgi:hypothetical protein
MSTGQREAFIKAKAMTDEAYEDYRRFVDEESVKWAEVGYGDIAKGIPSISNMVNLAKDNWGKIAAVGAGFGIPVGVADPGAFKAVLGVISNLWPF